VQGRSVVANALRAALVALALTVTGHSGATDRELTESADFRVRVQAALRLGRAGASARPDLELGLRDAHPAVRVACAVGLGNIGDRASIPALERAARSETYSTAKTAIEDTITKINAAAKAEAPADPAAALASARYVVQLGAMKNVSGVRSDDLDGVMRRAARAKAGTIKGALVVDGADAKLLKRATERRIPVLQVDGNLTRLTQSTSRDGATVISAKVDMSIRKLPGQTLKGTVSGNASGSNGARASSQGILDLQNRVVGGAVESAMGSMGNELASLAR
jgi:hypothetical protein